MKSPTHKPYTFAIRTSPRYAKNCKRVCLANANSGRKIKPAGNKELS